jgi:hypothetical protein
MPPRKHLVRLFQQRLANLGIFAYPPEKVYSSLASHG